MSIFATILGDAKSAVSVGKSGLGNAAQQAVTGNLSGALDTLSSIPGSMIDSIGSSGGVGYGNYAAGINARGDAMQNWSWYCVMPTLSDSGAISIFSTQPSNSLPWYYVQEANLPIRTIKRESLQRLGHQAHYAESYDVADLSLKFFLDGENKAYKYLKEWQGLVLGNADPSTLSNQGKWGMPAEYKKPITLVVMSVNKKTLLSVKYIGCWPTDPSAIELTSGAAEALSLPVSFAVEDVNITVLNDKGLLDNLKDTITGYALSGITNLAKSGLSSLL